MQEWVASCSLSLKPSPQLLHHEATGWAFRWCFTSLETPLYLLPHKLQTVKQVELRVDRDPGLGLARATATLTAPQVNTLAPCCHLTSIIIDGALSAVLQNPPCTVIMGDWGPAVYREPQPG